MCPLGYNVLLALLTFKIIFHTLADTHTHLQTVCLYLIRDNRLTVCSLLENCPADFEKEISRQNQACLFDILATRIDTEEKFGPFTMHAAICHVIVLFTSPLISLFAEYILATQALFSRHATGTENQPWLTCNYWSSIAPVSQCTCARYWLSHRVCVHLDMCANARTAVNRQCNFHQMITACGLLCNVEPQELVSHE